MDRALTLRLPRFSPKHPSEIETRWIRQFVFFWERLIPFLQTTFSSKGLGSPVGRTLIIGKLRRITLCLYPPLAASLSRKYNRSKGCSGCGTSCNLLFQCPHWDTKTRLCTVYEDRPNVCRYFPITPADIRERNLIASHECGYQFDSK
jgi:hypothetical protein